MIGRTNAEIPGSDNVTTVHYPTATAGITVTASKTGTTKTALTDSDGIATFKHLELGYDWTFTAGSYSTTKYLGDLSVDVYFRVTIQILAVTAEGNVGTGTAKITDTNDVPYTTINVVGQSAGYPIDSWGITDVEFEPGKTYRFRSSTMNTMPEFIGLYYTPPASGRDTTNAVVYWRGYMYPDYVDWTCPENPPATMYYYDSSD